MLLNTEALKWSGFLNAWYAPIPIRAKPTVITTTVRSLLLDDPDQRKPTPKAEKFESGSIRTHNIEKATLSPTELRKGALPAGSNQVAKPGSTDNRDPGRSLSPSELGYTGGLFNSLLPGGAKTEAEPFTGEPPRTSLTQPPTGYQTPSPNYPYGVGPSKANTTKDLPTIKDRAVGGN